MAFNIIDGFYVGSPNALDKKTHKQTILQRDSIPFNDRYLGMEVKVMETGKKYELISLLEDNDLCWRELAGSGSSGTILYDTYDNIKALAIIGGLVPESIYVVIDFITMYTQYDSLIMKNGVIEPLTLTAATSSTFYKEVRSGLFPKDDILYDFNGSRNYFDEPTPLVANKGVIVWRKDDNGNSAPYDIRNILWTRSSVDVLTFGSNCTNNVFGNDSYDNVIRDNSSNNKFGYKSHSNTFGTGFASNNVGDDFFMNVFGISCVGNTFGSSCQKNVFGDYIQNNVVCNMCYTNNVGDGFISNVINNNFYSNNIDNFCTNNIIGDDFYYNTLGINFRYNEVRPNINSFDFTGATHVYSEYHCTLSNGVASDGITLMPILSYFDTSMFMVQYVDPLS